MHHLPIRKSKRVPGFDYSESGSYFITICTNEFKHYFGEVKQHLMVLNQAGCMLYREWENLGNDYDHIKPQEFIVMPNHVHGIIEIQNTRKSTDNHPAKFTSFINGEDKDYPCEKVSVSRAMQIFKSKTTLEYIKNVKSDAWALFPGKLWQKNYYEHIIRDQKDYERIAEYILHNPVQWMKGEDEYG